MIVIDYAAQKKPMDELIAPLDEEERNKLVPYVTAYLNSGREDKITLNMGAFRMAIQGADEAGHLLNSLERRG